MADKDVLKKVKTMRDNAFKGLAYLIKKQKDEISRYKNILKQYNVIYDEEVPRLEDIDRNQNPEAYDEAHKEIQDIQLKVAMTQETIAQYQHNLNELGALEEKDL